MFIIQAEFDVDDLEYVGEEEGLMAQGHISGVDCEIYIPCKRPDSEKIIENFKED